MNNIHNNNNNSKSSDRPESDLVQPQNRSNPLADIENSDGPICLSNSDNDLVYRFALILKYYQSKYPNESQSAIALNVENILNSHSDKYNDMQLADVIMPLIKGYEEQLEQLRKLDSGVERKLNEFEVKITELVKENEELRKHGQIDESLRQRCDILMEENTLLVEELRRNQPIVESAFHLEQQLKSAEDPEIVRKLKFEITELVTKLKQQQDLTISSQNEHQLVLDQLRQREQDLVRVKAENEEFRDRLERISKWHNNSKTRMDEYDDCCQELGISDWLPEFDKTMAVSADGILIRSVRKIKRDWLMLKRKLEEEKSNYQELTKAHTGLIQRYQLDLNKSEETTRIMKDQFEQYHNALGQTANERDLAIQQSHEQAREIGQLRQRLQDYMNDADLDNERIIRKTKERLEKLQQDWSIEREQLQREILELKKSKTEMQNEIGHLLRDKRVNEIDIGQALKNLDAQRDKFKRSFHGMSLF